MANNSPRVPVARATKHPILSKQPSTGAKSRVKNGNSNKSDASDNSRITRNSFPRDFMFGTGTAAYQNEGAAAKYGRGPSIWDDFCLKTPHRIQDGSCGNVATDMYHKFKEDIKNMKKMGFDAYRFSISWPRILPGGRRSAGVNQEGIDYYNEVIDTLLAHGITPFVTLFHWDLPQCLQDEYDGFLSRKIVADFREFAELCFWEFGDRVKYWVTLNEAWTYCAHGYAGGLFPPSTGPISDELKQVLMRSAEFGFSTRDIDLTALFPNSADDDDQDEESSGSSFIPYRASYDPKILIATQQRAMSTDHDDEYDRRLKPNFGKDVYTAVRNMLLCHAAAVESYRTKFKESQDGKIGITLVTHWFEPLNPRDKQDKLAAKRAIDFMLGWLLEPILRGRYPKTMRDFVPAENLAPISTYEAQMIKGSIDFLGLNYYTTYYASYNPKEGDGYYRHQKVNIHRSRNGVPIGETAGSEWLLIVPSGLHKLLKYLKTTYQRDRLPSIYITENGVSEKNDPQLTIAEACVDPMRTKYYQDHLANVLKAVKEGVDVKGYFAWTWCDNFEWNVGYNVRFGLMYVDFKNDLRRYPKQSVLWFAKFLKKKKSARPKIQSRSVEPDLYEEDDDEDDENEYNEDEENDQEDNDNDHNESEEDEDDDEHA